MGGFVIRHGRIGISHDKERDFLSWYEYFPPVPGRHLGEYQPQCDCGWVGPRMVDSNQMRRMIRDHVADGHVAERDRLAGRIPPGANDPREAAIPHEVPHEVVQ